jgi:hypothetical protein
MGTVAGHGAAHRVAARHEPVLYSGRDAHPLAGGDGARTVIRPHRPFEAEHRHTVNVQELDAEGRMLEPALGLGDQMEAEVLAVPSVVDPPAGAVLEPDVHQLEVDRRAAARRGRVGIVASEAHPEVAQHGFFGVACVELFAVVEEHGAVAEALDGGHVVGHEHEGFAGVAFLVEDVHTFLGEGGVADGEHFVDQHDVGVCLDHDGEGEPDQHPGGVVLELELDELVEAGEVEHGVEALLCFAAAEAHHDAVQRDVLAGGELGVEADAELDEGGEPAGHADPAAVGAVDAGQDLQQRRLARPVAAHDPEELAPPHLERNPPQRPQLPIFVVRERVRHALLDGVHAVRRDPEALLHVPSLQHHRFQGPGHAAQRTSAVLYSRRG